MASIILKRKSLKDSERTNRHVIEGKVRDSKHKVVDAEDDEVKQPEPQTTVPGLTPEEVAALIELIPYKEALIKIAKGEFEIEKIVEEDDEEIEEAEEVEELEEDFGEDEEGTEIEEDDEYSEEDEVEDYTEDEEDTEVEDSALEDSDEINEAWKKRLCGQQD